MNIFGKSITYIPIKQQNKIVSAICKIAPLALTIFWRQIYNNHKRGDYKIEGEMVKDTEGYYKWENIVYMLVDN